MIQTKKLRNAGLYPKINLHKASSALFVDDFSLGLSRQAVGLIKDSFLALSGRSPPRRGLAEIDGPSRRPLLLQTLMRCVLSGISASRGADGRAAVTALRFNSDSKSGLNAIYWLSGAAYLEEAFRPKL